MTPLIYNIIIAILSIVYVFAVVGIMDFLVKRKNFPQDISRKIVHIAAGSWLLIWLLFDDSHWSRYLNIAPAFIWTVLLLLKGFTASSDDEAVKTMTRTGDRRELLKGPLYFTLVMCLMGTVFYKTPLALTAMGILGWGDGLAPVFGKRFGKHKYYILSEKSIEGSLAFLIFGFFGALIFNLFFYESIDIGFILGLAILATFIEAVSPKDFDNLLIPLSIILAYLLYY
ncbi:MAG: phosphatidate cytidylyltransferase [Ignavibacteriales bacterium]|jgi:dolichol kinase|nr:MAG: phosphatidate cytidylyltransferase [Ignavibacteriales bacterium]